MSSLPPTHPLTFQQAVTPGSNVPAGRIISSAELLDQSDTLTIRHQDEVYFLRRTRAGKLILTK